MYGRNVNIRIGGPLTPYVRSLMIANGIIFLIQQIFRLFSSDFIELNFGLSHTGLVSFMLWQPFTYMFLHGGWLHIIFNLLGLWMFGGDLEELWGGRLFIRYYLYSGIGAGLFIALMNYFIYIQSGGLAPVTIGASGAIYAILLAYGMTWPNREVLLYFIIPIKIKYLVIGFGMIEFFGTLSSAAGRGGDISHIGHLGGLISGFIFIKFLSGSPNRRAAAQARNGNPVVRLLQKARMRKKRNEIETRIKAKKIINELLEKIARKGMGSLSDEEKNMLEWARKNYYPEKSETLH